MFWKQRKMVAAPVGAPTGAVDGGAAALRQRVAELKEQLVALRRNEAQLAVICQRHQSILDQSLDAVITTDRAGRILTANPSAVRMSGHTVAELQAMTIAQLVAPERLTVTLQRFNETLLGAPQDIETAFIAKDGRRVEILATGGPIMVGGEPVGVFAIIADITERKRAEAALRQSEARARMLADVVELSSQPFAAGHPDGRLSIVNAAFCQLTGYSQEELQALSWVCDLTPVEWRESEARQMEKLLHTGQPVRYEKEYLCKDGRRVPVELFSHVVVNEAGQVQYCYSFLTDLTERKRAEGALRQTQVELEERVAERTAELSRAIDSLHEEARERQQLEHEVLEVSNRERRRIGQQLQESVCQQLAGVSLLSKALAEKLAANRSGESATAAEIGALVNQTLVETRGLVRGLWPVHLAADTLAPALQDLAASAEQCFHVRCASEIVEPLRLADEEAAMQLYQIAQEAISEAVRHRQAEHLWVRVAQQGGATVLIVSDDGEEPAPPPHGRNGLSGRLMRYRAQMMGGTLTIQPEAGGGTVVTCSIPSVQPTASQPVRVSP